MIGKIKRGKDFVGVCIYVLHEEKVVSPKIIGGNMANRSPIGLAREFRTISSSNSRVKIPVKHFSISFAPQDGRLDSDTKAKIAKEYINRMGYGNNQYLVVNHDRTDHNHNHDHIHIVANAVDLDGKWVNDRMNWKDSQRILRNLEREFELTPVLSTWDKSRDKLASTHHDRRVNRLVTSGITLLAIELDRQKIQTKIDVAATGAGNIPQFCARLQSLGVEPIPRITRTGRVQGLSYKQGDIVCRGSDLNSASFPALQSARGIGYDEGRDLSNLKKVAKGGVLMADKDWLDRLPEIKAKIDGQIIIPIMPEKEISINIAQAQREAEAQYHSEELAAREIAREYGGYSMER